MKNDDSFSKQIDDVLSGKYNRFDALKVCDTPRIFLDAGLQQLPILYTQNHLKDALHEKSVDNPHWHGLSIEQIKKVPKLLESPVLLMDSLNNDDSIVAVLSLLDNDNAPVFATIKPNGNGIYNSHKTDSNFMLSIYGKEKGFEYYIKRAAEENKILYWNKEKSQEIQCAELLMAQGLDSLDSNKILHQTNSLVNKTTSTLVIDSNQAARIKAAREIKENMPSLSENERTAAIAILEAGAKSQRMSISEYMEKTFPNGIFGDIKNAENAAKQQGVKINGAVSVNGFGENVKAVIYAGKNADFSTWCHELSHIWQAQLAGELKNDAEEAFQVKDSDWQNSIYTFKDGHTDTSAEAFAYGFEDFLKNKAGEMAAENKKKIFEKFADYMSRTYNGVKQHIEINEKIASVYQKFVELDDNILAQAEKAVQMEVSFSDYFDKTNSIFFELDSGDTTDVSDSILEGKPIKEISTKEFNYDGSNLKDFALNYIKNNPVENAKTKIGNIEISETGLRHSLSHTIYKNKLYAIPAIKDTLEKGTYLGVIKDFEGKRQNNYYFAAPITIDNDKNILFIRVKHVAGRDKALYIHDIFTLDEIKKVTPYSGEPNATRRSLRGATLAKSIIQDYEKNNIIQNNPILFQTAYHGSGANFDKFNTSEYGLSGEGYMAFGYGTYVTDSETIAKDYASGHGKRKAGKRNFYTVEIPDENYLKWEKKVGIRTIKKIASGLENLGINNISYIRKDFQTLPLYAQLNYAIHNESMTNKGSGKDLYITVGTILHFPADKETSKFFKDMGFSGIQYPAGTVFGDRQNAVNYVIFNDEDIKIKEHFQFQKQEEDIAMKNSKNFESQKYWKNQFQQDNAETFKAIDDYLDKGIRPKNDEFIFEKVPEILKAANVSENEIVIKTSIINKAKNEHSLFNEEIKDSIKNIASPVLIFDSDKTTTENKKESFLCLTDTFAANGKPIAFSMNIDSDYKKNRSILTVNQITSIHDRTLIAKNGTDLIQKWTENGLCRYVDDKKISEWQLAAGVQFPLAVLHPDKNNIALTSNIVNGTDYKKIQTFSEFAEQQKNMEKEYQEYLGTISPDEESSRRIDSGEIFGKFEHQQAKEELNVSTYKFQSGENLDEIIQGNSDFPTETALLDNMIDGNIREVYEYATNEEKTVLRQFAAFRNDYDTDMKNLTVQTDCVSRWIAAKHWNPEMQEFQEDYVNHAAVAEFPYKLPWEMKEIEAQVLQTENETIDKGIESIQVNGGMSEAAMEADYEATEKENIPELKIYHTLKKDDVRNLEVISDQEFSDIVDSIILNDYKNIPNAIRLPNLNEQLSEKLGLEKDSAFILKKNATHIRPDRKGGYGQAFDAEEYRRIPEILRNADFAVVDTVFQNFQIVFDDKNDGTKINKLVFNKDELGNYLVTLGKVDRESAFSEERNPIVAVGVAPTIQTLRTSASSTALRASTTMGNESIAQSKENASSLSKNYTKVAVGVEPTIWRAQKEHPIATMLRSSTTLATEETISQVTEKSINEEKIKMPDQPVYAAAKVGQVIEQRTQEAQSIVNPTRADRLSTISVPLNKEYNEDFALSTVKKLLETEKNMQNAAESELQQTEPGLQKKFDQLKEVLKSREEQDSQEIASTEEPKNKMQPRKSKSDIIRQAGKDLLEGVKKGIAPFFNTEDDFQRIIMHPQAIINASNGLPFSGESQLLAQIYHKQHEMEGEIVTSIAGAKAAGTIVLNTKENLQKNFALTDTSLLAEKNTVVRTRYFMPESCKEPDKIYAHTLQQQRPDKIRSYRDLIRHFENIPNGQKEITDIRIRIAHEHLKEIQSRFAIKEERTLSVDEIEERKNFLRNYFERLPADYRDTERSAFEDTFGIQLNSEKNLEINLQRKFKDIDFDELKKNTKKSIELENRKLSNFIEKNTMDNKKLASLFSNEYKSLAEEEKLTARNLKIEALGIKEPETFLGKYLAACNTNAEFITDKETVEEVKKNLVKKLEENFKLEKYDILKEIGQQAQSISNETTKQISFEKAHSNNKSLGKTLSPDKEISLIGMGK